MEFALEDAERLLARTPPLLDGWLRGLPDAWVDAREGPGSWSPREVIGHLIHGEDTDWIPRARIILEHGASRAFEPFDRLAQLRRFAGAPVDRLLEEFAARRAENLKTLRGWRLTEAQLALPGLHPELGPVTLAQLLATWVTHDLTHIVQIARVMAKRYDADVGPWKAYIGVLARGA
jgi:hypothetical protein